VAKSPAERKAEERARKRVEADVSAPPSRLAQATALAADMGVTELLQLASIVDVFVTSRRDILGVTIGHDPDPKSPSRAGIPDLSSASKSSSSQGNNSTSPLRSSSSESRAGDPKRDVTIVTVTESRSEADGHPLATKAMGSYMRAIGRARGIYERRESDRPHFESIASLASKAPDPGALIDEWATRYVAERSTRSPKYFAEHCERYAQSGPRVHGRLPPAQDPGGCDDSDIEPEKPKRVARANA
jgi:hypothetical protein